VASALGGASRRSPEPVSEEFASNTLTGRFSRSDQVTDLVMMPARIDGPGVVAETGRGAETLRPGGEVYRMVLFDHDGDLRPGESSAPRERRCDELSRVNCTARANFAERSDADV
jgi:hypothetical protein